MDGGQVQQVQVVIGDDGLLQIIAPDDITLNEVRLARQLGAVDPWSLARCCEDMKMVREPDGSIPADWPWCG